MKTIEIYESAETAELKSLLAEYEKISEENEILIDKAKLENEDYDELQQINDDYEIDISIIRMELTKRLWYNK